MGARHRIRQSKIQREAEGYLELGLPRQALGVLGRLGDPTGFDAHAMYLWGEALRSMERYEEALVPLRHAAHAEPEYPPVWIALGWCYKRTGRLNLAIEAMESALAVRPDEAVLHYNLACYWSLAGNRRAALRHLSRSFVIDPNYRLLIDNETDFDAIRSDPEFRNICGKMKVGR